MTDIGPYDAEDPAIIAEGPFGVIAHRVRRDGKPYGGQLLRETADKSAVVCKECGPIGEDSPFGLPADWGTLCHDAMDHADQTGHTVAVESWQAAIYGPRGDSDD
jgi:hypothetical protein